MLRYLKKKKVYKSKNQDQFGEYISQSYSRLISCVKTSTIHSVKITDRQLSNLRDDFYLKIIDSENPKRLLIERFSLIIDSLIDSKEFTKYDLVKDQRLFVYAHKSKSFRAEIKKPIITYGSSTWNDIVIGTPALGISRNNGIIMIVKNKNNELMMIVIDPWSLCGTAVTGSYTGSDCSGDISSGSDRKILFANLTKSPSLRLPSGRYVFSLIPPCTLCHEYPRNVPLSCGHAILCENCMVRFKSIKCPICHVCDIV
jgi:hypothetical protein